MKTDRFVYSRSETVQTHGNEFDLDELIALTILSHLDYTIVRNDTLELSSSIFINISNNYDGKKYFDADPTKMLENVWEAYGREFCGKFTEDRIDDLYFAVRDNILRKRKALFGFVEFYKRNWNESESHDYYFSEAMKVFDPIFMCSIGDTYSNLEAENMVKDIVNKSDSRKYILFETYLPWNHHFQYVSKFKYIIYPTLNKWRVYCVPTSSSRANATKVRLPAEWVKERPNNILYVAKNRTYCECISKEAAMHVVMGLN